jgi:hypothetical protein
MKSRSVASVGGVDAAGRPFSRNSIPEAVVVTPFLPLAAGRSATNFAGGWKVECVNL